MQFMDSQYVPISVVDDIRNVLSINTVLLFLGLLVCDNNQYNTACTDYKYGQDTADSGRN